MEVLGGVFAFLLKCNGLSMSRFFSKHATRLLVAGGLRESIRQNMVGTIGSRIYLRTEEGSLCLKQNFIRVFCGRARIDRKIGQVTLSDANGALLD